MSEFQQQQRRVAREQVVPLTQNVATTQKLTSTQKLNRTSESDQEFEALLDQIDAVLETNAEEYVRGFVQKGGQ